jgi:glucose-6-phosphate 1-epimerase
MSTSTNPLIQTGMGNLPKIVLATTDGARAEIYLHGAHVTSWVPVGGSEALFLSPKADFRPGQAIRGGVPVIFPQFGGLGQLPAHGFARNLTWDLAESASDYAILRLRENENGLKIWPHKFELEYTVRIGGNQLELSLKVNNTDSAPFEFTAALHTYLRVNDVRRAAIGGLKGLWFIDKTKPSTASKQMMTREAIQEDERLHFPGEVDSPYFEVVRPLQLEQDGQNIKLEKSGFADVVVWNPGPEKCAALKDMQPDGYLEFVCVEAAAVEKPIKLAPGESWVGVQRLVA